MSIELIFVLCLLGGFVGMMAGLLGIGGGLIVVPALTFILPLIEVPSENIMPMALGTSLATIIITSGSSAFNHLRLGNIDFFAVKWLMPGVVVGGFLGAFIVEFIPAEYLPRVFGVIVVCLALQMLFSSRSHKVYPMPSRPATLATGSAIGVVSSLAGIGGGSLSVPFLNRHGVEMRRAVGSSSVCGCVLAIAGMLGFVLSGVSADNLPQYSLGYVYLPALIAISLVSAFTTRFGALMATSMPTVRLKRVFALFLFFVAGIMLLK
ncbi:sulfite exporter TauE/SafE family protein [Vibrio agarivorans]|uniref:sulfite exporter TauE/SafE family protein n=1 Tax=Vibrio agarivorans TaxID=153622 RepID=UPI00222FFF4A|nr:sulfite exporter TauE/SafE family protein [Vibrio agarivorans]MDN3662590.1 sulfite exporter TauE/SafE family protein [Vibrio agarivorans]